MNSDVLHPACSNSGVLCKDCAYIKRSHDLAHEVWLTLPQDPPPVTAARRADLEADAIAMSEKARARRWAA
ncbi:hypothetical protein GCM10025865_00940 [Paraoerskovia sediminicola]|uniref:Uncharacterized protein n=2 Tax=Paraoerskovia sediminicola TaxID=1138587 RepID=A0ABM8FYV7_9CELL|nr:hypothetical protein GCM10025865_00940 [Paraoerskovia sediminicola]